MLGILNIWSMSTRMALWMADQLVSWVLVQWIVMIVLAISITTACVQLLALSKP